MSPKGINISDQGVGLDPPFLPHVFERLRQADGSNNRSGLGLGLAIARHIVDLHNGKVIAESEGLGRGARFNVTLPILGAIDDTTNHSPREASAVRA